jgi:hypothetical protein
MNRKGPIMMALGLLLGAGITLAPLGVSVQSAGAAAEARASAHEVAGMGLVTAVDTGTNTLVLETRSGVQRVHVAPAATIRADHDDALAFSEIRPGDAVAYEGASGDTSMLHVARQFWAMPSEG